jgi:hypothetical protein
MRWTVIVPWRSFELATSLTPEEAADALGKQLGEKPSLWKAFLGEDDEGAPYRGTVSPSQFKILRNIQGRNSFQPIIEGTLLAAPFGTRIRVRMRLMRGVLGFASALLLLAMMALIFVLIMCVLHRGFGWFLVAAFGFTTFGILMPGIAFAEEAAKAEKFLRGLFPPAPPDMGPYRTAVRMREKERE